MWSCLKLFWNPTPQVNQINSTIPTSPDSRFTLSHITDRYRVFSVSLRGAWALLLILFSVTTAGAGDKPFDMSANWGGTGLMEVPTARILPDGAMRFGLAKASPYIWYTFGFGILPSLEFTGRYTDVTNVSGGLGEEFGSFKDKAFDIKYQLFSESKHGPAVAVGLNDFQGTRQFESQYLAISRQLYPLDITLGVGRQRFKGPLAIDDEIGFWGGVEWAATDRLHLMLEYNPIEYQSDPLSSRGVPQGSDWPINMGMRYRTWLGMDLGLSYQRGDTFGLSAHMQFDLGRPILPPKPDPPSWHFAMQSDAIAEDLNHRVQRLSIAIEQAGFINVKTIATDGDLMAEVENTRYLSDAQAAGRVMRLLLQHANSNTEHLTVVLKRRELKILYASATAQDARRYFMGEITEAHFNRRLIVIAPHSPDGLPSATRADITAAVSHRTARRTFSYGIDPILDSYFNDPSGVYHSRLSLRPHATWSLWPGGAFHGSYDIPLYSDVESTVETPAGAVRSDAWKYLGGESAVNRLLFDQMIKLGPQSYVRFSAGYLERMYAGVGGEVLRHIGGGHWAIGLEGDWVYKREPDDPFELMDQYNHTLLGNLYYRYLPLDITLKTQVGRFLAGDTGVRLEFRRRFDTGAQIGFWYSLTDTDHLTGFNQDYNDKGISLSLPFAVFTDHPTRRMLHYSISPWTRDVGVTIDHWQEVYNATTDLIPLYFSRDLDRFND